MIESNLSLQKRLSYIKKLVCISFVAGIAFSFNLWISDRFFPLLPIADFLPIHAHVFNYLLASLFAVLLVGGILFDHRVITITIVVLLVVLLLEDQSRWQTWVYVYFLFLLPFAFVRKGVDPTKAVIPYLQIAIIGVYAWSGIHKFNQNFIDTVFYEILTKLFWFSDVDWIAALKPLGYMIPVAEIAVAFALFLPKFRNRAVYVVIIMHAFILCYLSPIGINDNSVVYPWNFAMTGFVFLLFYDVDLMVNVWRKGSLSIVSLIAILLVWIMPVFNLVGYWDNYLSFNLYSGNVNAFYIAVADSDSHKIDKRLANYFLEIKGMQGGHIVDINKWSMRELNVPFYSETRCLKQLAKPFCELGIQNDQLYFLEYELPFKEARFKRFTCSDIK